MICLNCDVIALLLRVLFQFANIPSAPRLALYYLTSQIRDCWNYQERFRLKRWGEKVIYDHFCLVKKIDKIERIVPKKTHYLYFDARRHNTATIFKWANRKNQTRKLSLSPLKQLYASPSFMLRVCTLPYLKSECFFASCWKGLENMVSHRFPCFIVFFYFVGHFSNL